jgi:hypothetical protein
MNIYIIGKDPKNIKFASEIEERFSNCFVAVVDTFKEAKGEGVVRIGQIDSAQIEKCDIVFSYENISDLDSKIDVFKLDEDKDKLFDTIRSFSESARKSSPFENRDATEPIRRVESGENNDLRSLIDSDAFTIAGSGVGDNSLSVDAVSVDDTVGKLDDLKDDVLTRDSEDPQKIDSVDMERSVNSAVLDLPEIEDSFEMNSVSGEMDLLESNDSIIGENDLISAFLMDDGLKDPEESHSPSDFSEPDQEEFTGVLSEPEDNNTAPGILRKNNQELESVPSQILDKSQPVFAPNDKTGDIARVLMQCHNEGYTGAVESEYYGSRFLLVWSNGLIADIEGYGTILARLLSFSGLGGHVVSDLSRSLSDPIELALSRNLITPEKKIYWLERCREEAFISMVKEDSRVEFDSTVSLAHNFRLALEDPSHLILRGIVENYSGALSWARGQGESPVAINKDRFEEFIEWKSTDPLWIRTINLFNHGMSWSEATIRGGLKREEGESLLYGLRVIGLMAPTLTPGISSHEFFRKKLEELYVRSKRDSIEELLDGKGARARRKATDIRVLLSEVPSVLRQYMEREIQYILNKIETIPE